MGVPSRRLVLVCTGLLWGVGAVVALQASAWSRDFYHDDAYITLRYAQNWLAGNGVGWNPGDRVEGYTNFLQLLLATGLGALGLDLVRATHGIGLAAWLGLGAFGVSRLRGPASGTSTASSSWAVTLPTVASLASVPLITWVYGGLEAPIVAVLVTTGFLALHDALQPDAGRRRGGRVVLAGFALGLACLARLDAGLFVAVGGGFLLLATRGRERVRVAVAFGVPLALVLAPWLLWKAWYYGSLLPNTWWAKGTDPSGWRFAAGVRYATAFLLAPPFPVVWLVAGALRAAFGRRFRLADGMGLTAVVAQLAWVVYVGGDQMPASRLLIVLLPVSAWLAWSVWRPDLERLGVRGVVGVTLVVSLAVGLQLAWPGVSGPQRNATSFIGAAVGHHMAEHFRPGSLVALNTAGSTPFHAPSLRYIDMLGLNDAHIARRQIGATRTKGQRLPGHAKGDGDYVLAQLPDYVILGPSSGVTVEDPWFLSDLEISENPSFLQDYRRRVVAIDVRARPGFRDHPQSRAGAVRFTYYERLREPRP